MIRVVLDTNILVSAAIKHYGAEAIVLDQIARGMLTVCVSEPILAEYHDVLLRPKLRLDPTRVQEFLRLARAVSLLVAPTTVVTVSPDPPDNRFLECAEAAGADFLVSGNKRHFPPRWKTTQVVNARELLHRLPPR